MRGVRLKDACFFRRELKTPGNRLLRKERTKSLFDALMNDYKRNAPLTIRANCSYSEFDILKFKSIIDEIDRVLARHYGLSDDELEFITNYDIKYRMGRDGAEDVE